VGLHVAGGNSDNNLNLWIGSGVVGGIGISALLFGLYACWNKRRQDARRRKREEEIAAALAHEEAHLLRDTVSVQQPDGRVAVAFTAEGAHTRDGLHRAA
jgi:hypothetical protein